MKWPFVSRATHESMREWFLREREDHSEAQRLFCARVDAAEARYASLLDKYTSLKMAGAVEVPKEPERIAAAPVAPVVPDEMRDLIHARAGTNYRKRAMMLAQLEIDRTAHVSDDTIRDAILNGVPSDGVPA